MVLELIDGSSECDKKHDFGKETSKHFAIAIAYSYLNCLLKVWVKKESVVTWESIFRFESRIMSYPI